MRASLAGCKGISIAKSLCRKLMLAAGKHDVSTYDYNDLMEGLLNAHPAAILDELFSGDARSREQSVRLLRNLARPQRTMLDAVADEVLLAWCDRDPVVRYPIATSLARLFRRQGEGRPLEWTPLATSLLAKAPDPSIVLDAAVRRFHPSSWSGSLASTLEERSKLLDSVPDIRGGSILTEAITRAKAQLKATIDAERQRESDEHRNRGNGFE